MLGPDWWALDGQRMRVAVPSTPVLVRLLLSGGKRNSDAAGLWVTFGLTDPRDVSTIIAGIYNGSVTIDDLQDIADALVLHLTGWNRWEAEHVWKFTIGTWEAVDGDLLSAGVDLSTLAPGRATNAAYSWWRRLYANDEKAWKKFEKEMRHEPRRVIRREAEKPMSAEDQAQLEQLIAAAAGTDSGPAAVPASTITMPPAIP